MAGGVGDLFISSTASNLEETITWNVEVNACIQENKVDEKFVPLGSTLDIHSQSVKRNKVIQNAIDIID
jgi:hypothetical protein